MNYLLPASNSYFRSAALPAQEIENTLRGSAFRMLYTHLMSTQGLKPMHNHPPVDAQRIELHIRELEARLELLSTSFMADMSEPERMNVQRELFALQTALEHYKTALQVELSENFPPPSLD